MISSFRDAWLDDYYFQGKRAAKVPASIDAPLRRKLDILHTSIEEADLRIPPGNRFEHLQGNLKGWCSIRVNKQYRLIFRWEKGRAEDVYLDPHKY